MASNELGKSTSPYLRQHAENPVHWREWSDGVFAEARERDVPVFLSVGYSACHWCHVMAHESFEDEETAAYLNEHFVCVKVDREERPDVDAIYMQATVAMTGQGGWPMSVFLTPTAEPFFCGTYFPSQPRPGMATFRQVLESLVQAWRTKREQIDEIGRSIVNQLGARPNWAMGSVDLDKAVALLKVDFDPVDAGFGKAPKFPPSMVLDFLLRHHRRTGSEDALKMVAETCERMARGGMYDQLAAWVRAVQRRRAVGHPALREDALRQRLAARCLHPLVGDHRGRAAKTHRHRDRRLPPRRAPHPRRGFASALDADTEGEEGLYYVWSPEELHELLGAEDAAWVIDLCDITGTFEHGTSVLQLRRDPDDPARWHKAQAVLRTARRARTYPGRDDKVVAAWNGLAITALARAGVVLEKPEYVEAAVAAAGLVRDVHLDQAGILHRTSRDGQQGTARGVLEDYAAFAQACLTLLGVTGDSAWLELAQTLLDRVLEQFVADGIFYDTAGDAEALVWRPQDSTDNASPAGVSLAAEALTTLASVTGSARYEEAAEQALQASFAIADRAPRFVGRALAVAETIASGPLEIAVVGASADLLRTAMKDAPWGTALATGLPGSDVPLLVGRGLVDGRAAAYVCQKFTCRLPVVLPEDLRRELNSAR